MDSQGPYLNLNAVASPVGVARVWQIVFSCVTVSLVAHQAGFSEAYGTFCMFVWCLCLTTTACVVALEFTRLHTCLRLSWDNFTITFAMLATLMCATASVVYPVYFLQAQCPHEGCEVRNYRIAVTVFSCLASVAYLAEVIVARAKPGHVSGYMATASGLLKIVQAFVACIIFGALVNESQYRRHVATQYCVAVYSFCFAVTVIVVLLTVSGKTPLLRCPFDRFVVVYTFVAVLMYVSVAVIWPVFCFDKKYGSPERPYNCPRGKCPWESQLVVTIFTYINLILYIADLAYSQRIRFITQP